MLAPYLAAGWRQAARSFAELLEGQGQAVEASTVFRANMHGDGGGWR